MPIRREQDIQGTILGLLESDTRFLAWRQNAGKVRAKQGYVTLGPKGCGDIAGLVRPDGRHLEIEVKKPGEEQTKDQLLRQQVITQYGGIYVVTHSLDHFMMLMEREGREVIRGRQW